MSVLIDELKNEHAYILNILNEIKETDIASAGVWDKFKSIQSTLESHLQKEDDFIYPALKEAAPNRAELRRLLDSAHDDMAAIAQMVQAFFEKYPSGGKGAEFKEEFNELMATIRNRILNEENVFFVEYELLHE